MRAISAGDCPLDDADALGARIWEDIGRDGYDMTIDGVM